MGRKKDWGTGALRTLLKMQEQIREQFGDEAIIGARQRLCQRCKHKSCELMPICTDGKDCPYFELREGVE